MRDVSARRSVKDIPSLTLFTGVARLGSFSAAAREAGLVQSQASRMVAELEASLGARLLLRTTRAVTPTEAGAEFLARIEPILAALEDAGNSVRDSGELQGLLRVAMPTTMGIRRVLPRLAAFTAQHPLLRIDVMLEDRWQDMVREAVDVGIRVGTLPDAAGTARQIATMPRVVVAAPAYMRARGRPRTRPSCRRIASSAGRCRRMPPRGSSSGTAASSRSSCARRLGQRQLRRRGRCRRCAGHHLDHLLGLPAGARTGHARAAAARLDDGRPPGQRLLPDGPCHAPRGAGVRRFHAAELRGEPAS